MGEGKSEGTLRTSRSAIGQEQIDGPTSIAMTSSLRLTDICVISSNFTGLSPL
jgi:hypothetical protein